MAKRPKSVGAAKAKPRGVTEKQPLPAGDGLVDQAKGFLCIAAKVGHSACPCPICEEGRRNP